jgi:carboxylesterase
MTWHGQINRTIWEIKHLLEKNPKDFKLRRELLRTYFLQRFEYDRSHHIPRDDRSFIFLQDGRAPAALLIHGSKGTPAEMRDLGNYLYSKGFTVFCPRMSRFDVKDNPVTWESWVTYAESALSTIMEYSKKTVVVGLSLGGTVGVVLERLHEFSALVLLAPAVVPRLSFKDRLRAIARYVAPGWFFRVSGWDGEVVKAMEFLRKEPKEIACPTLVLQALDDRALSTKGLKLLRKWATHVDSEVVILPTGTHALTRGTAKEQVFERVYDFTEQRGIIQPAE